MFIYALTPVIGSTFPALIPIILAAGAAMGYKHLAEASEVGGDINNELNQRLREWRTIEIPIHDMVLDAVQEEVQRAEAIHFEKDGIILAVIKDERGRLKILASASREMEKKDLFEKGRAFAEEIAQLYAQHRAVEELARLNAEVVQEEVNEQGEIKLTIRRWT